ncbi:hypothetical protein D3C85_1748810 [compost metagenome]
MKLIITAPKSLSPLVSNKLSFVKNKMLAIIAKDRKLSICNLFTKLYKKPNNNPRRINGMNIRKYPKST